MKHSLFVFMSAALCFWSCGRSIEAPKKSPTFLVNVRGFMTAPEICESGTEKTKDYSCKYEAGQRADHSVYRAVNQFPGKWKCLLNCACKLQDQPDCRQSFPNAGLVLCAAPKPCPDYDKRNSEPRTRWDFPLDINTGNEQDALNKCKGELTKIEQSCSYFCRSKLAEWSVVKCGKPTKTN